MLQLGTLGIHFFYFLQRYILSLVFHTKSRTELLLEVMGIAVKSEYSDE
jgi:hypothetical protein